MKLSDNEIIKTLKHNASKCRLYEDNDRAGLYESVLDFVSRLTSELERLQKECEDKERAYTEEYNLRKALKTKNEQLNRELTTSEMAHSELLMIYDSRCAQLRRYQEREYKLMKELAELIKVEFYKEFDELIPSIMSDKIDKLLAELTDESLVEGI